MAGMKIDPAREITLRFGDLYEVRTLLLMCQQHHEARDFADSAAMLLGEVTHRPLTKEINRVLTRVQGLLSDALMDALEEEEGEEEESAEGVEYTLDFPEFAVTDELPAEDEEETPLPDNPLGSRTITPPRSTFFEDGGDDAE